MTDEELDLRTRNIVCRTCKAEKNAECVSVQGDEDLWVGDRHEVRYIDALEMEYD